MKYNLDFISEVRLTEICKAIINIGNVAIDKSTNDFNKNIVDPFSAIFDSAISGITLSEWIEREKTRKAQKTLQNAIGFFHQQVLGSVQGWKDLGTGSVVDLCCSEKKIIAEIKNKWNTTKGNHKVRVYDDIARLLKTSDFNGYTGYYVAVLSKKAKNIPFTPSDNENAGLQRPENDNIREIDGASFYALATGNKDALKNLYITLPLILGKLLNCKMVYNYAEDPIFTSLAENSISLMK